MNQNHETKAKREAQSGKLRAQHFDPERLRKAIQYLGEHPAIPARAPTTPTGAFFPPISPRRPRDHG
jgi:hypothetical protein